MVNSTPFKDAMFLIAALVVFLLLAWKGASGETISFETPANVKVGHWEICDPQRCEVVAWPIKRQDFQQGRCIDGLVDIYEGDVLFVPEFGVAYWLEAVAVDGTRSGKAVTPISCNEVDTRCWDADGDGRLSVYDFRVGLSSHKLFGQVLSFIRAFRTQSTKACLNQPKPTELSHNSSEPQPEIRTELSLWHLETS